MTKNSYLTHKNPQFFKVEHRVTVENLGSKVEKLHLWIPKPPQTPRQPKVKIKKVEPAPTKLGQEKKYGNEMYYWQIEKSHLEDDQLRAKLQFTCTVYETRFKRPTKTPSEIKKAKQIYDRIINNFEYQYPPKDHRLQTTLKTRAGDCGSFAILFSDLCQKAGIDARPVFGFNTRSGDHPHAWAEFFLPEVGWIPIDLSRGQKIDREYYFGNLDNQRLTFSKGTNYHLTPPLPNGQKALFLQSRAIWIEGRNYDKIKAHTTLNIEERRA